MSGRNVGYAIGGALLALGAVGCGPPMNSLTEGVTGPYSSEYSVTDVTQLSSGDYQPYDFSTFYVQAVINGVVNGDVVKAALNDTKTVVFTAMRDGDVGLMFKFDPGTGHWKTGANFVTVVHGQRGIGRIDFNIRN